MKMNNRRFVFIGSMLLLSVVCFFTGRFSVHMSEHFALQSFSSNASNVDTDTRPKSVTRVEQVLALPELISLTPTQLVWFERLQEIEGSDQAWLNKREATLSVMTEWEAEDFAPLFHALSGAEDKVWAKSVWPWVMLGWVTHSPVHAVAYVEASEGNSDQGKWVECLFAHWSKQDPVAAMNAALQLKEGSLRALALNSILESSSDCYSPRYAFELYEHAAQTVSAGLNVWPIFVRWGQEAIPAALAAADSVYRERDRLTAFQAIRNHLSNITVEELLALLQGINDAHKRALTIEQTLLAWAVEDPENALNVMGEHFSNALSPRIRNRIYELWASEFPQEALEHASASLSSARYHRLLSDTLENWVQFDPHAAVAFAVKLEGGRDSFRVLEGFIDHLAEHSMDALLYLYQEPLRGELRYRVSERIVSTLAAQDPQRALTWAKTHTVGDAQANAIVAVVTAVAERDPAKAAQWVSQIDGYENRENALLIIADSWAKQDIHQAFQWLYQLPNDRQKQKLYRSMMQRYVTEEPRASQELVASIRNTDLRNDLIHQLASSLARENPVEALQWAYSLGAGESRDAAFVRIVDEWGKLDLTAAFDYALHIDDSILQQTALRELSHSLMEASPEAVSTYLERMPEGALREHTYAEYARTSYRRNPQVAQQWLSGVEPGRERTEAIAAFVDESSSGNPELALSWAVSLPDGYARSNALDTVFMRWSELDPLAARAAIKSSEFDAATEASFLAALEFYDDELLDDYESVIPVSKHP